LIALPLKSGDSVSCILSIENISFYIIAQKPECGNEKELRRINISIIKQLRT